MPTGSLNEAPFSQPAPHDLGKPLTVTRAEDTARTIHRSSISHHGARFRTLGHAAEYLATRSFSIESTDAGDRQAIHILMRLSREIFDDYANLTHRHHPIADWIMGQAVRL